MNITPSIDVTLFGARTVAANRGSLKNTKNNDIPKTSFCSTITFYLKSFLYLNISVFIGTSNNILIRRVWIESKRSI